MSGACRAGGPDPEPVPTPEDLDAIERGPEGCDGGEDDG